MSAFDWFLVGIAVVYVLPTVVAFWRGHPNRWVILLINAVFGGTVLGWFGALIWAMSAVHRSATGNHGGESGLNIFANDPLEVRLEPQPPASSARTNTDDEAALIERLQRTKALRDQGLITEEEYRELRQPLIRQFTAAPR